jgi:hypothetical protein
MTGCDGYKLTMHGERRENVAAEIVSRDESCRENDLKRFTN